MVQCLLGSLTLCVALVVLVVVRVQDKTWLERTSETVKDSVGTGIGAVQRRLGKAGGGGGDSGSGYMSHNVGGYHDVSGFFVLFFFVVGGRGERRGGVRVTAVENKSVGGVCSLVSSRTFWVFLGCPEAVVEFFLVAFCSCGSP